MLLPALALALATAGQGPAEWYEPFPAHKVVGNVYYVGSKDLATYLITTDDGHILINSGFERTVPLIQKSVESLGFKMTDVKILLASHAHSDHVGGHARLQKLTGAKVVVMRGDDQVIASGGKGQYKYTTDRWEPCKVDRVLADRDVVKLGGVTLVARLTPGHTRGCTTWTWRVEEGSKKYDVVVIGSPNVNPGFQLVGNKDYPEIADDFAKTFAVLKSLPCDVFLGAHGGYYGMVERHALLGKGPKNPFVNPEGYREYVAQKERAFRKNLAAQQEEAKKGAAGGKLTDADRVLLLGGGFIEQERLYGYLETRLLRHHPRGQVLFRNLGWGGDTVRGSARTSGFDNPEGFARLFKEVTQWKPTVIFVGYGMNESFAGAAGIEPFIKDYGTLLDKLAPLKARVILLSPTYHEPLGPPYPDPTEHNAHLTTYSDAIHELGRKCGLEFIDLYHAMKSAKEADPARAFTTNGIQPNAAGYAVIARTVESALAYPTESDWRVTVSAIGGLKNSAGAKVKVDITNQAVRITVEQAALTVADPSGKGEAVVKVTDMPDGTYELVIGRKTISRAEAKAWEAGLRIPADDGSGEKLRQAVIAKNELWYRRWRPFNDHSRHFDFMKGDFSLYDKAIAEQERVIQALLVPRPYSIAIVPAEKQK